MEVSQLRGFVLLIVAGALVLGGCGRRETEGEMRERVRREERKRQQGLTRERERTRQAERLRLEQLRRDLVARERKLKKDLALPRAKSEAERLPNQPDPARRKATTMGASMGASSMGASRLTAPPRAPRRYKNPAAPAPRRRLKRPRRRRSPSLEGLFE